MRQGHRNLFRYLLLASLGTASFGTAALGAQQVPAAASASLSADASVPCAPVRDPAFSDFVPSFPDAAAYPELARSLSLGYRQFYGLHDHKASLATMTQARAAAVAAGNVCAEALALYILAHDAENDNFDSAPALLLEDIRLFNSIQSRQGAARAQFELGRCYVTQLKYNDALALFTAAAKEFELLGDVTSSISAQAAATLAQKEPDYEGLLAKTREHHLPCIEAQLQRQWSDHIHLTNHLDEAMMHAQAADALYANCPRDMSSRASVQTSMGRMERQQGRPLVALEHYRLALQLQLDSNDLSYVPQTYNAMGVAYESMLDYAHAIPLYKKGLAVAEQIHSRPFIDFLEGNLAATYSRNHQPELAIPLFKKLTEDVTSDSQRCTRFGQLGTVYQGAGDLEKAAEAYRNAVDACRRDHNNDRVLEEQGAVAEVEHHLHRYEDSLRDAYQALALTEEARDHLVATDAYKQGFTDTHQTRELYNTTIADLSELHRAGEAFEVAEQARSRAFLDLLASHRAAEAAAKKSPTGEDFRKDLIASPEHVAPLTSAAMLEAIARLHSTLLAYWVSEDTLYIWIARPGEPVVEATRSISADRLAGMVARTHKPPANLPASLAASRRNWRSLYRLLIAPVADHLPRGDGELLTIVPSGPLFALSFPALLAPDGHFLAERFRTHTIPTVGMLAFTQRNMQAAAESDPHFLLVDSPGKLPLGADGHELPRLDGTAVEVASIARLLPAAQVTRLEGRDANVGRLGASLTGATTLHFATHAVLNDADPYASFLALDDSHHDGKLTVANIYALQLKSRLVVLSACSTALGKVTGDGVAGMSRAFFYAGSASVLATLWDIADQPTAILLPRFYKALAAGESPSVALRTTQLAMLHDLRLHRIKVQSLASPFALPPDPAYWAAFSLSGEP